MVGCGGIVRGESFEITRRPEERAESAAVAFGGDAAQ